MPAPATLAEYATLNCADMKAPDERPDTVVCVGSAPSAGNGGASAACAGMAGKAASRIAARPRNKAYFDRMMGFLWVGGVTLLPAFLLLLLPRFLLLLQFVDAGPSDKEQPQFGRAE